MIEPSIDSMKNKEQTRSILLSIPIITRVQFFSEFFSIEKNHFWGVFFSDSRFNFFLDVLLLGSHWPSDIIQEYVRIFDFGRNKITM